MNFPPAVKLSEKNSSDDFQNDLNLNAKLQYLQTTIIQLVINVPRIKCDDTTLKWLNQKGYALSND